MSSGRRYVQRPTFLDLKSLRAGAAHRSRSSLASPVAALLLLTGLGSPVWAADLHITQGVVDFASSADLGSGNLYFDGPVADDLTGARLRWAPGNTADISDRSIFGRPNFDTNGNDVSFAHAIFTDPFNGDTSMAKLGAGTLTLAGDNYFGSGVTVKGGTLAVSGKLSVPNQGDFGPGMFTLYVNGGNLKGVWVPVNAQQDRSVLGFENLSGAPQLGGAYKILSGKLPNGGVAPTGWAGTATLRGRPPHHVRRR